MAEDERMDIQASYSSFIADYKAGLLKWLEKDLSQTDEFEDQELDALLLQVRSVEVADARLNPSRNNLICSIRRYRHS